MLQQVNIISTNANMMIQQHTININHTDEFNMYCCVVIENCG